MSKEKEKGISSTETSVQKKASWRIKLAAVAFSMVLAFGAGEIAVRLYDKFFTQ